MSTRKAASIPDRHKDGAAALPAGKLSAEQQAWLNENRQAIEDYNQWMEAGQDPFAALRRL